MSEYEGLTEEQVSQQRLIHGSNQLDCSEQSGSSFQAFVEKAKDQICNPLIGLLAASALISLVLRQWENAIGIVTAISLVAVVGAVQEMKTEGTLNALKQLAPDHAHVIRQGKVQRIEAGQVVMDDLFEVRTGDRIPADGVVTAASELMVDESVLNGESQGRLCAAGDQVWLGATVQHGWARVKVTAVGQHSQFGRMAVLMSSDDSKVQSPLQMELDRLAHRLTVGSIAIIAIITAIGCMFKQPATSFLDLLTTAVSLAVAAIPEGLPLVSTVTMALAVRRLALRGVIVKRMSAVERMGAVSMVCFDKTGTLTENRATVAKVAFDDRVVADEHAFLQLAASCTDVVQTDQGEFVGNAVDVCLIGHFFQKCPDGCLLRKKESALFSSQKRSMRVELVDGRVIEKGAMDTLVPGKDLMRISEEWSEDGLRVIGVALDNQLMGVVGMSDQIRVDAVHAIQSLSVLSVSPIMLTGDGERTARAVASSLRWPSISQSVHFRQSPLDKLAFIQQLQQSTGRVAMVGDGVNDGAALKSALVGISMGGQKSTDVARQAADIVLLNDHLAGICDAVLEGRAVMVNIQRFIGFQLSSSMASLILVALSSMHVLPSDHLSPIHLLLLNIVMDGPPAQSLAMSHVPVDQIRSPPTHYNLLSVRQLGKCLMRALMVVCGCILYGRQSTSILPPLLVLSMANAVSWCVDPVSNSYLQLSCLLTVSFLIITAMVPWIDAVIGVGHIGWEQWMLLALMASLFAISNYLLEYLHERDKRAYYKL